ncbi:hypothetical protein SGRA_1615 [Saprospira grandis str. Lewin]|uniref:Uncharacterized protein n=1 Tax=Saprospira grandis (strain Lewin) TaxID=984262 RepID=H6L9Y7_SAPGL|nr:hypothetical protein SGRA_1615 [Saprospira grandis str. Lewin]
MAKAARLNLAEGWIVVARRARPKFFEAKRKKLQGRADLRATTQPDPAKGRGSPKKNSRIFQQLQYLNTHGRALSTR